MGCFELIQFNELSKQKSERTSARTATSPSPHITKNHHEKITASAAAASWSRVRVHRPLSLPPPPPLPPDSATRFRRCRLPLLRPRAACRQQSPTPAADTSSRREPPPLFTAAWFRFGPPPLLPASAALGYCEFITIFR